MTIPLHRPKLTPEEPVNVPDPPQESDSVLTSEEEAELRRIKDLPKEVGVMLMTVGVLGLVLPGVVGTPAMIAGGLVLWPKAFGKVENWFERKFPKVHKQSLHQIHRYLNDLENRYPDSTQFEHKKQSPSHDRETFTRCTSKGRSPALHLLTSPYSCSSAPRQCPDSSSHFSGSKASCLINQSRSATISPNSWTVTSKAF